MNLLTGGGEMGALIRAHDWSASPIGPLANWPQSLKSVASLLLNSRFPMWIAWGPELTFIYNDAFIEIARDKHPAALGSRFRDVWAEALPDVEGLLQRALAGEADFVDSLPVTLNRNGRNVQCWFTFCYSPVRGESGAVAGVFNTVVEMTGKVLADRQRAEAEAALRDQTRRAEALSRDREVLLAEANHRFKNSLQLFAGLLRFQLSESPNLSVREHFAVAETRLYALAKVHEQLWLTGGIQSVNLAMYLRDLCNSIAGTLGPTQASVSMRCEAEAIQWPADKAVSVGLILNELVTNSFKYGFPSGRSGEIVTRLKAGEDGIATLTVQDNGVGTTDIAKPAGQGLRLVHLLAKQLDGSVCISGEGGGATVTVKFPV